MEELKADYCCMRLPHRPELEQPFGLCTAARSPLIDTVMVPAVGGLRAGLDATLSMDIQYLGPVAGEARWPRAG